jgi:5-methylcytosine-specific restriction enzyme subunit McrC
MNKLLEVREFDTITCNADYIDDDNYKYLDEKIFQELVKFIHEFAGDNENADALEFMRIGYKRNIGDIVSINNYVGLIQMKNGFQVQILPKIDLGGDDNGNAQTKSVFVNMLKSMKDFPGKAFNEANLKADRMNLYEMFINMYLRDVRRLVKRGIKSDYVEQEGNLNYFKGKLVVSKQLQLNKAHRERFYMSFDEFQPDRPENRIVKATLTKLQALTTSSENAKEIRQLLPAFELVGDISNFEKEFSQVKLDRNTKDYENLIKWSKVFLMNKSFTTFTGKTTSRALLFPMETVYESYVAQQVKKIFGQDGWDVSSQVKGQYLFVEPREQFALKPDIVAKKGSRTVIMDTKWKRLINNESKNYGISQSDMYQMYAYSKKYNSPEIWLLYPINNEMRGHEPIEFVSDDETCVKIHFVDLAPENIEDNIEGLKSKFETDLIQ